MRARARVKNWGKGLISVAGVLFLVGGVIGTGIAQEDKSLEKDAEVSELQNKRAFDAKVKKMSPQARAAKSFNRLEKMKDARGKVSSQLNTAKSNGESAEVLNCINGKLSPMNSFINLSENSYTKLKESDENNNVDGALHYYSLILTSQSKVMDLARQAKLCKDQDLLADGSGDAVVTEDPSIPDVVPIQPGGYADVGDVYGDVLEPEQLFPFTPFQ